MKFVSLVSGGKDSCYNTLLCLAEGHELVCLANLYPEPTTDSTTGDVLDGDEIDSYMYQTVGHDVLTLYEKCTGKPMYREPILGRASNQKLEYDHTVDDETEDLYRLLRRVQIAHPDVVGVSVGAILSSYQRTRVEDVCARLGMTSLAYMWQRDQRTLMDEMCSSGLDARIIKVAAYGLDDSHLGMSLQQIRPTLQRLNDMMGVHVCGEGGEFETSVFDAPFFKYGKIVITEREVVKHTNDSVWYLKMKVGFEAKEVVEEEPDWKMCVQEPPALNEKFEDLLDEIAIDVKVDSIDVEDEYNVESWGCDVFDTSDKVYISNISSDKNTVEDQIVDIFEQLKTILDERSLTFSNVISSKLLVKNMSNFGQINSIYTKYFTKSLPPSRICVETCIDREAHLSVVVLRNAEDKVGLHIQGRSFWAPCNIGPYSQAVGSKLDKVIRISGQIPLIPKNMELSKEDVKYNAVLALQHYDSIKEVMNYKKNLLTVCFVNDIRYKPLVTDVFEKYMEKNDDESNSNLIVVLATGLPRGADVEWAGLAYNNDSDGLNYESDSEDEEGEDRVRVYNVDVAEVSSFSFNAKSFYEVYAPCSVLKGLKADVNGKHIDVYPMKGDLIGMIVVEHLI